MSVCTVRTLSWWLDKYPSGGVSPSINFIDPTTVFVDIILPLPFSPEDPWVIPFFGFDMDSLATSLFPGFFIVLLCSGVVSAPPHGQRSTQWSHLSRVQSRTSRMRGSSAALPPSLSSRCRACTPPPARVCQFLTSYGGVLPAPSPNEFSPLCSSSPCGRLRILYSATSSRPISAHPLPSFSWTH